MDRDIEQAGDTAAAAGQVPTCPMCGRTSHGFACDGFITEDAERQAAAAGQVPAEAVEAAKQALKDWHDIPGGGGIVERALAAAAPLIVADRWDVEKCDHCGEEKRVAWWYEKYEVAICGDCHEAELLERDRLRAEVDRLTAELETSRKVRNSHAEQLSKDQAKLAAVAKVIDEASAEQQDFDDACVHIGELRAALAGDDISGGGDD